MDFRKRIVEDFAIIFNGTDSSETEKAVDGDFANRWGWFGVMHRLCREDISKLEAITELNLLECLTWLSYEMDLSITKQVNINGSK